MPLTRANVTVASRIMLPTYVALSVLVGLAYVIDPWQRIARAPSYKFQRDVEPLWVWGAVMLAIAVLMLAAFSTHSRATFAFGLGLCATTWLAWGATILPSVWLTPNTSLLAPLLPWFVAVAAFASMLSLLAREH